MKRRGISILLGVCSVVMLLQGCSKGNASKANDICVDTNAEYIQLELTDKVHIAADITPYDKYKDGLSSYFLESYIDMGNVLDEESLQENVKLFKQDMYKVIENIEKNTEGTFSIEDKKITYFGDLRQCELDIPHTDEEGIIRSLIYIWYLDEAGNAFAPEVWFDCRDGETEATLGEHYLGRDIFQKTLIMIWNLPKQRKQDSCGRVIWKA